MHFDSKMSAEETQARVLIEKKTVLNLIDAFGVSVKHYLRGEEGMLCIHGIFKMFYPTSPQTSPTWIYITRPNIFLLMHYPRACHPLQMWQRLPRINTIALSHVVPVNVIRVNPLS